MAGTRGRGGAQRRCGTCQAAMPMRERLGSAKAIVPSAMKVGGVGARLDLPLGHINAAYVRSHFDAMEIGIPMARGPDEIVCLCARHDDAVGGSTTAWAAWRAGDIKRLGRPAVSAERQSAEAGRPGGSGGARPTGSQDQDGRSSCARRISVTSRCLRSASRPDGPSAGGHAQGRHARGPGREHADPGRQVAGPDAANVPHRDAARRAGAQRRRGHRRGQRDRGRGPGAIADAGEARRTSSSPMPRTSRWPRRSCRAAGAPMSGCDIRVGEGWDVHQLVAGRKLILGGVEVPHIPPGCWAIRTPMCCCMRSPMRCSVRPASATSAAISPTPIRSSGAPTSSVLLAEAARRVRAAGWEIGNVDSTVIAQAPKLAPHIPAMCQRIAATLGLAVEQVNVQAARRPRSSARWARAGRWKRAPWRCCTEGSAAQRLDMAQGRRRALQRTCHRGQGPGAPQRGGAPQRRMSPSTSSCVNTERSGDAAGDSPAAGEHRRRNTVPDLAALEAMVFYIGEFPEKLHHPKESRPFPRLRGRDDKLDAVLDRLDRDHAAADMRCARSSTRLLGIRPGRSRGAQRRLRRSKLPCASTPSPTWSTCSRGAEVPAAGGGRTRRGRLRPSSRGVSAPTATR